MTSSLQRTAIILLATSALCASPAAARTHHHHAARKGHHAAASHAPAAGANGAIVTMPGEPATYVVKKGDTLDKIADQLDTTTAELKRINKLKSNALQPGDELKGPAVPRKAYVVAHGDTVFSIAKRFKVTVDDLRGENGLTGRSQIHSGQKLKLPAGFKAPAGVTEAADEEAQPKARRGRGGEEADQGGAPQRGANGRVEAGAGRAVSYRVRRGDTLDKIADKLGTSVAALKRDNRIRGNAIRPGQTLKGPRSEASRVYVAASGDSLSAIAERFGVSVQSLKAANGLKRRASSVRAGQRLRLPGGARDHGRSEAIDRALLGYPRPAEPEPRLPSQPQPYMPSRPQPYQPPGTPPRAAVPGQPPAAAPAPTAGPTDAQITEMSRGRFIWPLKGDLISDFGPLAGGQKNDGINIRAEAGAAVRSAADGDVVYAGDQVPGFGNLVLIKHADGWVTAYGHLARIDVKNQQKVTQGQQVGQAGQTGGVTETQLHFEVRYAPNPLERARPVDPKLVLPK